MFYFKNSCEFHILFHKYLHICVTIKIIVSPNLLSKIDVPERCHVKPVIVCGSCYLPLSTAQGITYLMQVGREFFSIPDFASPKGRVIY